jgi:hypothetical protein
LGERSRIRGKAKIGRHRKGRFFSIKHNTTTTKYIGKMSNNTSSKDYGLESQRTIRYRPTKMTFREYDKKIINFRPGLKYWHQVLDKHHEWKKQNPVLDSRGLPLYVNGIKQTKDHYTPDEQEELKMTDRISVSSYVQGNGPEMETYR